MKAEETLQNIIGYSVGSDKNINSNTDVATINECLQAMDEYAKLAFEAARKITPNENYLKPITYNVDGQVMYELSINYKYNSFNDWKENNK